MTTFTFTVGENEEEFGEWLINGAFEAFAATLDGPPTEVEAEMVSPKYSTGITLTGAD